MTETKRKKTVRGRLLRGVIGVVYLVVLAEVFLRVFAPVPMLPRHVIAGPHGVRANKPSAVYQHRTPDYRVEIRTNAAGMRLDGEVPIEKPPGEFRVVVLGDSFGMGYGVNIEDTFPERLRQRLDEGGLRATIVNLSVSGFGTAEELVVLREEGFAYSPDAVVVCWHASDLDDNVRSGLFTLADGEISPGATSYLPAIKIRERLDAIPAYRWLAGNSHLYTFLREKAGRVVKDLLISTKSTRGKMTLQRSGTAVAPDETQMVSSYRDRLAIALLQQIEDDCVSAGARLVVLEIPVRGERDRFVEVFPRDAEGASSLPVVSPKKRFEAAGGELIYWENSHGHWTPLGTRIVGDLLAGEILSGRNGTERAEP